jgi:glycosyltransferase involved in cell wall biosynthesis
MPKISCITATYQRPKLLELAIKSVNAQTFKDWEHIIVFDGQADPASRRIIDKYQDPRRVIIELEQHTGTDAKPKNTAIMQAQGEYVCFLDDDNQYCPNFMEVLLTEIELLDADVVYGDMRLYKNQKDKEGTQAISSDFDGQFLMVRNYIDFNMVLVKKTALYAVGGIDETLPRFKDWNLFVRMAKAGLKLQHVPVFVTKYYITKGNSAEKAPVKSWTDSRTGILMFDPTFFSPSGCKIWLPYLGGEEKKPKVAIFMLTKDRKSYTQRTLKSLKNSTKYPFDLFIYDNGSTDGTKEWLKRGMKWVEFKHTKLSPKNVGITAASNECLDEIAKGDYQLILKLDNDVEFLSKGWLEDFVALWQRNHKLFIGPYPEGLIHHPGGVKRLGHSTIGDIFVEVVNHLSGFCNAIDAKAYKSFRWTDKFLHGNQDAEFSQHAIKLGYMPCIYPKHRVMHMDTVIGQQKKYKKYFARRKYEKTHQYEA